MNLGSERAFSVLGTFFEGFCFFEEGVFFNFYFLRGGGREREQNER